MDKFYFSVTKKASWQGNLGDSILILGFIKFLKLFLIKKMSYKSFRGGGILRTGYIFFSLSGMCAIDWKPTSRWKRIDIIYFYVTNTKSWRVASFIQTRWWSYFLEGLLWLGPTLSSL